MRCDNSWHASVCVLVGLCFCEVTISTVTRGLPPLSSELCMCVHVQCLQHMIWKPLCPCITQAHTHFTGQGCKDPVFVWQHGRPVPAHSVCFQEKGGLMCLGDHAEIVQSCPRLTQLRKSKEAKEAPRSLNRLLGALGFSTFV